MKAVMIVLGVAGLVLGSVGPTPAHMGDRVYPIFELTDEDVALIDVVDGSIDDWLEVVGEPSLTSLDFYGITFESEGVTSFVVEPHDLDFRIWLAWHDATDRVYVAMERADDEYVNEYGGDDHMGRNFMFFWDGSIALAIDGDHSGGGDYTPSASGKEEQRRLWHQHAQGYEGLNEVPAGRHSVGVFGGPMMYDEYPFYLLPPYAEGGGARFGEQPTLTVTEFYVTLFDLLVWDSPKESQVSDLFPGKIVGMDILVVDKDSSGESWLSLPEETPDITDTASEFQDAVLLGLGGGIPPDESVVESITWGRIKATFVK